MSGPNNPPPSHPVDALPPLDQPVPVEGVLTAEEVEEALRSGITFADLIRDIEALGAPDA